MLSPPGNIPAMSFCSRLIRAKAGVLASISAALIPSPPPMSVLSSFFPRLCRVLSICLMPLALPRCPSPSFFGTGSSDLSPKTQFAVFNFSQFISPPPPNQAFLCPDRVPDLIHWRIFFVFLLNYRLAFSPHHPLFFFSHR